MPRKKVINLSDTDNDQFPDSLEAANGLAVGVKDNNVFTSAKFFVMQLYRDMLYREGESAGVQYWQSRIEAGDLTRSQVASEFLASREFHGGAGEIVGLYLGALHRLPDVAGMEYWMAQLHSGTSVGQISETFAADQEFSAIYGSLGNTAFVEQIYLNVLGRAADAGGEAYWSSQLEAGTSRGTVVLTFIESTEFTTARQVELGVALDYLGLLGRTPEPDGYAGWVAQHQAGVPEVAIIGAFIASQEYHDRFLP